MLIKRIFDFSCSVVGLILLLPAFAVVACLIKLDSVGPVFFRQVRVGRNCVPFRIFKFRTMVADAAIKRQITVENDPRVTRVGRVLRKFKIDEFPQLLNVLRGEMSLVGPRPEVPKYVAYYPAEARRIIFSVLPGITDWASIRFKNESAALAGAKDAERAYVEDVLPIKLEYCMRYVRERSFTTDLKIIFLTVLAISSEKRSFSF